MEYQDFVLQLDRAPGAPGFITRVIRSPAGEAEAPFVNPVTAAELDELWLMALATRQGSRTLDTRHLVPDEASPLGGPSAGGVETAELALEGLGSRLFQALFRGPVRSCWVRSLAETQQDSRRGLRLKLQLNPTDPLVAPLAELPWEYLFSLEHGGFLALQRKTPVLRHMRLPLPPGRAPVAQPLRVLIVSAQPCTMAHLSLKEEGERIAEALGALPAVETQPLHNPSIEGLRDVLLREDFHVLHFMGHGGFDEGSGQGVLYFTDADEQEIPVSGLLLASHLTGLPSLRLAFINACDTARSNACAPFAGVATALLRAGLPAVVAMQRPIGDEASLELSRSVYRRLAAGDPVDAAVTEGRLAITRGRRSPLEWGTPVLFLRADDGRLFAPAATPSPEAPALPFSPVAHPRRLVSVLLLGGIVAAGLTFGALNWQSDPEQVQMAPLQVTPTHPSDTAGSTSLISAPPPATKDPALKPANRHQETRKVPAPAPPPDPSGSTSFQVAEGSSAVIRDLQAEVGAYFFEREGRVLARFWVETPNEGMLQQPPVLGPGMIEFQAKQGTYRLEVLTLDGTGRRATVRLRFLAQ